MADLKNFLPKEPMAPMVTESIPTGSEWGFQLKWDGVRILSLLEDGAVTLVSRKLLNKTTMYPEVVHSLDEFKGRRLLLDGEVFYFHPQLGRPVFQKVLQRERSRAISPNASLFTYVLFDILVDGDRDLRQLPYIERHRRLQEIASNKPGLLVADLFNDGQRLWEWAEERNWEGIVIKRLSSPYREGKKHQDWYKKKITVQLRTSAIAIIIREGRVASLVLSGEDGTYIGRVSLGLNEQTKHQLLQYAERHSGKAYWKALHNDLKKEKLIWLQQPLTVNVTFLEWSQDGMMRHPKLLRIEGLDNR